MYGPKTNISTTMTTTKTHTKMQTHKVQHGQESSPQLVGCMCRQLWKIQPAGPTQPHWPHGGTDDPHWKEELTGVPDTEA